MTDVRVSNWQSKILKLIVTLAILGCIALYIGASLVSRTFSDIAGSMSPTAPAPASAPASGK